MKPTQTAIATALAVAVVAFFFMFNGFAFFGQTTAVSPQISQPDQIVPSETTTNTTTTIMPDATELQITDEVVGTGAAAVSGNTVTVNYVGSLTNGTIFDASASHGSEGFTFKLGTGQVIKGWDQGIVGMKEGGKRRLVIPAALAYGSQSPAPSIPPNSTLVFEVELLKVQK